LSRTKKLLLASRSAFDADYFLAAVKMKTFQTETGLGYFVDGAGHVTSLADLPPGEHPLRDGFIFVEVADREALGSVEIWQDPAAVETTAIAEKIQRKSRQLAIDALKAEGELPADYKGN